MIERIVNCILSCVKLPQGKPENLLRRRDGNMKKVVTAVFMMVLIASGLLVGCGRVLIGSGNVKVEEYTVLLNLSCCI